MKKLIIALSVVAAGCGQEMQTTPLTGTTVTIDSAEYLMYGRGTLTVITTCNCTNPIRTKNDRK